MSDHNATEVPIDYEALLRKFVSYTSMAEGSTHLHHSDYNVGVYGGIARECGITAEEWAVLVRMDTP